MAHGVVFPRAAVTESGWHGRQQGKLITQKTEITNQGVATLLLKAPGRSFLPLLACGVCHRPQLSGHLTTSVQSSDHLSLAI